jgi:hypothetical protein
MEYYINGVIQDYISNMKNIQSIKSKTQINNKKNKKTLKIELIVDY